MGFAPAVAQSQNAHQTHPMVQKYPNWQPVDVEPQAFVAAMSKSATGVLIAPPPSQAGKREPQRLRVYRTVLEAIQKRSLEPGARLPSARLLAAEWQVARHAVDEAFEQLQIEGFIERRVGDGTYVSNETATPQRPAAAPLVRPPSAQALAVLQRFAVFMGKPRRLEFPHKVLATQALFARTPMTEYFPLDTWRRLVARAHGPAYRQLLTYGPAAGLPQTREAIVRHLALTRGTECSPDQVLVLNSPMQAIELIARVLLEPGDAVWVEDPGNPSLAPLLRALHAQVVPVPFDDRGLDVAAGRRLAPGAAAVYLHALCQFPLGRRTTTARRAELLAWANQSGAWIIDGNFNDEIAHDTSSPMPFQRLDNADRVLTMGTFEGILYPALRLAYLVVPLQLVPVFVAMRGLLGDHSSNAMQLAVAWFIDEGHMSAHLRNLRRVSRERGLSFSAAIERHVPAWARLGPTHAGTHACLHLPPAVIDRDVVKQIRERDVIAIALSSMSDSATDLNGLVLGYAAFDEADVERAVAVIGDVLRLARRP